MRELLISLLILLSGSAYSQVDDPVPETILPSGLVVKLQDFTTIPQSSNSRPLARINLLREAPDGSGRLFVNDLRGELWVIVNGIPSLYADLDIEFPSFIDTPGFGTGFGAFAFHPDFENNGLLYTSHAEFTGAAIADYIPFEYDQITMQWVLTEWQASDPTANIFSGTKREILRFDYPGVTHGMQEITFNPSAALGDEDYGLLYMCLGDGGSSLNSLDENIQTINSFLGTIFRIDPLGNNSENGAYGIPAENPFVDSTDINVVKEIYAYGFRNPHRISWDMEGDHKMLEGDIGEKNLEEINWILPGHNYGWSQREGTFVYDRSVGQDFVFELPPDDASYNYTYPVAQYDHDEGIAVLGGYVYRGSTIPGMYGQYIFGDIASGKLFHIAEEDITLGSQAEIFEVELINSDFIETTLLQELNHGRADLRFGVDNAGEIYVLTKTDGKIRKLVALTTVGVSGPDDISEVTWLSPNPSDGWFHISAEKGFKGACQMTIVNTMGKIIWQQHFQTLPESINLSELPAGAYWVTWQSDDKVYTQSIQKIN